MLRSQLLQVYRGAVRTAPCRLMQQKSERCVNKVTLLGRVGRDVDLKGSEEHPMASFSLATSESFKSKQAGDGEYTQKTSWHRICVFRRDLIDTVYTYCKKGDRLYVTGKLDYNEYTNSDGAQVYQTSIIADEVIFLGGGGRAEY